MSLGTLESTWNHYLNRFFKDKHDIYYYEEYVKAHLKGASTARCFIYEADGECLLFPFLLSPIQDQTGDHFDAEVPNGYGGPLSTTMEKSFLELAIKRMTEVFREAGIVACLLRCHPLLRNHSYLANVLPLIFNRRTIAINLSLSEDEIWSKHIHPKHRNKIRISQRQDLRFEIDENLDRLDDFKNIYTQTMQRINATSDYLFGDEYFAALKQLRSKVCLGFVYKDQNVVSASIFFKCGPYVQYHLTGNHGDYLNLRPNNFLIYQALSHFKSQGFHWLHLGGGTDASADNPLFSFKARFSKDQFDYYLAPWILMPEVYNIICKQWQESVDVQTRDQYQKFLFKYRYQNVNMCSVS